MNWGKSILLTLLAFIVFIISMVAILIQQKVELVSEDYYAHEINFQNDITAQENMHKLKDTIRMETNNKHLIIHLPKQLKSSSTEIEFIQPSNKRLDKKFQFKGTTCCWIPKNELTPSHYSIRISIYAGNKTYLEQTEIHL